MITKKEYVKRINFYGREALASFSLKMDLENLMIISRHFWESVGLIDKEMLGIMRRFERAGIPSPSAKKGVVFGLVPVGDIPRLVAAIIDPAPSRIEGDLPTKLQDPRSGRAVIVSRISGGGAS
jgi:pantoate kinase